MNAGTRRPASHVGRWGAIACLVVAAVGCTTTRRIEVSSVPAGARILIDGEDSGLRTPSDVVLATVETDYAITLEKSGYNPVHRVVRLQKDVDVIEPERAAGAILCAPCCLGLPLLTFLRPVEVDTHFVPREIHAVLDLAGQGVKLRVEPPEFEVYVDGSLQSLIEGRILTTAPGDHEIEIRAEGHRPYRRVVRVDERTYLDLEVRLEIEGQGLILRCAQEGARLYVDGQFEGTIGRASRRLRLEPGPHEVRVEHDGHRTWTNVFQVAADRYETLDLELRLAGQGVIVRKPEGYPRRRAEVQILVGDELCATAFDEPIRLEPGSHVLEVRVEGFAPWSQTIRVGDGTFLEVRPTLRRDG